MIGFKSLFVGLMLAHVAVGDLDLSDNIFIQHMISSRAAPFRAPTYLPPVENLVCHGQDVCVQASECLNGYFSIDLGYTKRTCDVNTEICCTYKPKPTPLPSIPCGSAAFDCVSPNQCVNGEINIRGYSQKVADQCFAPEVCCRIPVESTVLEKDGYHVRVPETPFIIEKTTPRPFVPQPTQPIYVPPRTPAPIVYVPPRTPAPTSYVPQTQPPVYLPPATPAPVRPTPQVYVPPRTPAPTPYVPQTQPPVYLPPATPAPVRPTPQVYVPPRTPAPTPYVPQTQPPVYLPPVTPAPVRPTPQVYVPPRTPAPTPYVPQTQPPVYLPPSTPRPNIFVPQPTTQRPIVVIPTRPVRPIISTQAPIYLPPTPAHRGEDIKSEPIYKPKPTQIYLPPTTSRGENILSEPIFKPVPQSCAAALICTPIDFCTKEGVISKTPVSLSPNEELFRVPLTDCADATSGIQGGKCCRDPDYVDPWPTNLLISGQYDPTLFQQN